MTLPHTTMVGALTHFVAEAPCGDGRGKGRFQPMPPNFGLLPELPERIRDKRRRYGAYRDRALTDLAMTLEQQACAPRTTSPHGQV
jgi:methylenetetrahydrofolate--tRNA-(uracil-5-)-methyltransferase